MSILYLIFQEIRHRKLNSLLSLLSVSVAIACLTGAFTLLRAKQIQTTVAGKALEDSTRKITKGLGFNIFILPKGQDINELYTEGTLTQTMLEENVTKLANTDIITINHLLPIIIKKIEWKDRNQTIFVIGTRGEVTQREKALKKPLQEQIPKGKMMIGSLVASKQKLKVGDKVTLKEVSFEIMKINSERGNKEDSTVFIHLAEAQKMFGLQNLIHAIQALECNCATVDRIGEIQSDLEARLPGTQVIETTSTALARAKARTQAKKSAENSKAQFEHFASILIPLILVASATWIGFLAFNNAAQRADEIGILRAIGVRSTQIMILFLGKAILFGFLGAIAGYNIGYSIAMIFNPLPKESPSLFSWQTLLIALVTAPLLSMLGSWLPALLASQQDPAVVLQDT